MAASGRVELQAIKEELQCRGIEAWTAYELPSMGVSVQEHVEKTLRASDLVIAVISTESSPNVFFELGLAQGLGKQILLLVSPEYGQLPSNLAGRVYVRADPDNREAIGFALDQIQASSQRKPHKSPRPRPTERALGNQVDRYLNLVRERGPEMTGTELEQLVVDLLKASGVSTVTRSSSPERGAGIAVWSDDLQAVVGNPMLIEVKAQVRDREHVQQALEQVETYRQKSKTQWALLVLPLVSAALVGLPFAGSVLTLTIADLLERLRDKSFAETVRELRNARVQGGGQ